MKHGLVKYKRFESEDECKSWIKTQDVEWLPLHTTKGWYAAYSEVVGICRESVVKTSQYYKLNVQLAIDPQFGLNWSSCH